MKLRKNFNEDLQNEGNNTLSLSMIFASHRFTYVVILRQVEQEIRFVKSGIVSQLFNIRHKFLPMITRYAGSELYLVL